MGLLSRMSSILKAKMSAALDRAEDPAQTLDYSYEKQLELLRNVKRGVVEVVTSKRRLQLQAAGLQENLAKLEDQARRALGAGREDLARMALEHKQVIVQQLQGLEGQIEDLESASISCFFFISSLFALRFLGLCSECLCPRMSGGR